MDLQQLRAFVALEQYRAFTRAAAALHLSQPGITRQIQRLERELGAPLFQRSSRRLEPTALGELFTSYARSVVDGFDRIVREARGVPGLMGELRIGASTIPGEFLLPALLMAFRAQYPGVQPNVSIRDTQAVLEELRAGRHDLAFVGAKLDDHGLHYTQIAEDEVVLAVPADHPLAGSSEVPLDALAGQPFVEREGGSGTRRSVESLLRERGLVLPPHTAVMTLSNTEAVVSAVESGYGLGWVSLRALEHRDPRRVRVVRLQGLPLRRPLYLVYRTDSPLSATAEAFVAWIPTYLSSARDGASTG